MFNNYGKNKLKAVMTVEMSFIIPIIMLLVMSLILAMFYYHDKNILNGAAYETAVTGSLKMREKEKISESELSSFCRERLDGKCFFLVSYNVEIVIDKEEILVGISAWKGRFKASVLKKAALTMPEKKIRNVRRLVTINGAKNNN